MLVPLKFTDWNCFGFISDCRTDNLISILQPYGLIEFVRSARVAIIKDSEGFNSKIREFERLEPGEEVIENEYLNKGDKVFTM